MEDHRNTSSSILKPTMARLRSKERPLFGSQNINSRISITRSACVGHLRLYDEEAPKLVVLCGQRGARGDAMVDDVLGVKEAVIRYEGGSC
jgi:hypothetical protein